MEAKVQIQLQDLEVFENILELLEKHFDNLPKELQENLKEVSENGISDIDADYVYKRWGSNPNIETSFETKNILRINKILKKVVYTDDKKNIRTSYPEHFLIKINGDILAEW